MLIQVNGDTIRAEHISLITKGTSSKILPSIQTGRVGFAQCFFEIHLSSKKIIQIRKSKESNIVCELDEFIFNFEKTKESLISIIAEKKEGFPLVTKINF